MAAQKKTINLLPESGLKKGPLGKFLKWGLTFGRYIVVFTELIVIGVFIARFKLDRDLSDLNEEIKLKQNIVTASQELEKETRFLQKRLQSISQIQIGKKRNSLLIQELGKLTPFDVVLHSLDIQKDSISLQGESLSNIGLATFISGLNTSDYFNDLDFRSVSSEGEKDPTLEFELQASLKR